MTFEEVGKLFDRIVDYYPAFKADGDKIRAWHETLREVSFETARRNLTRYASDPDNTYAPHPGALAKSPDAKTDVERYHEHMRQVGVHTLEEYGRLKQGVTGPTPEQLRKVRESLG